MDRGSLGRSPTSPRPTTMPALLIAICLFGIVPFTEAMPVSSLPSVSTPAGILVAVVSVAVAVSLAAGLVFALMKFFKNWRRDKKEKQYQEHRKNQQEEESGPPRRRIGVFDSSALERSRQCPEYMFNDFLDDWNEHTDKEKEDFIKEMIKDFPDKFNPTMVMDALVSMLVDEVNPKIWMRMLRFTMMLERDLFHWDQTRLENIPDENKTIPRNTHELFQDFLVEQAENLLLKYGDVARPGEDGEAGFMRFIAYLFGFVCNYNRILKLMCDTWLRCGLHQVDASRAMVWAYARWSGDPVERVHGSRMAEKYAPEVSTDGINYEVFNMLMQELKRTASTPRPEEGSKAQHLLFALGCGNEPDSAEGPLSYMCDTKKYPKSVTLGADDYLWLMMGRDLVMGSAWKWMCDEKLSEHNRMCSRFVYDQTLYENVVDMVTKYEQDFLMKNGQCLMNVAVDNWPAVVQLINFGERRAWAERYHKAKKAIGTGIKTWLCKQATPEASPNCSL